MAVQPDPATPRRSRRLLLVLLAVAVLAGAAVGAALLLSRSGDNEDRAIGPVVPGSGTSPGAGGGGRGYDPLAYEPDREEDLERRAAAGFAHPLYVLPPGGALQSAARTARWRPAVDRAADEAGVDADTLEAMVYLESAGRADALAGRDAAGAAGLTQILAETGQNLLGMDVDLPRSVALTRKLARALRRGRGPTAGRLAAQRRRIDDRFDPEKALAATGRYLELARERFGRDDLAVVAYHMGIGNLESAIRDYAGASGDTSDLVSDHDLSYARLYFDSTPLRHAAAYRRLAALGDDSATYYWRILAAKEIMRLHREDPSALAQLAERQGAKNSAEEVLHPPGDTKAYAEPDDVADAQESGELLSVEGLPPRLGLRVDPRMGELAPRLDRRPQLYRALRPEALATLAYIGVGVRRTSRRAPLVVTSTVRDRRYQEALRGRNSEATANFSLHTTGYTFDVLRRYRSRGQALAFEFLLGRLQALNLIAFVREPGALHVTVSGDTAMLVPLLGRLGVRR